eukprot:4987855-Amphidinium_carterae.2
MLEVQNCQNCSQIERPQTARDLRQHQEHKGPQSTTMTALLMIDYEVNNEAQTDKNKQNHIDYMTNAKIQEVLTLPAATGTRVTNTPSMTTN